MRPLGRITGHLVPLALFLLSASVHAADVVEYYHTDGVGNVRVVTDATGNVVERHDYLPFGEEWCGTAVCGANRAPGEPLRFTGKERDAETGLDYFGARYYRANTGRFTTVDPVMNAKASLVDPQRWNRYSYGKNKPLCFVDPDGRDVSIGMDFTGKNWSASDKSAIIQRVRDWYQAQGVGETYVFDSSVAKQGAWLAGWRAGYASIEVSSETSSKHVSDKVYAGVYADLPGDERLNAIANTVIHETAAHQFKATYQQREDQIFYSRVGMAAEDPEARKRWGTVADSYAYGDERTRAKVTNGPIPINPGDKRTLLQRVGPSVHVVPPVQR